MSTLIKEGNYVVSISDCSKTTKTDNLINYKPFQKAGKHSDNDTGLGLGLAIVELLVKSINGKLSFANNTPSGVIVTVEIPIPIDEEPSLNDSSS